MLSERQIQLGEGSMGNVLGIVSQWNIFGLIISNESTNDIFLLLFFFVVVFV